MMIMLSKLLSVSVATLFFVNAQDAQCGVLKKILGIEEKETDVQKDEDGKVVDKENSDKDSSDKSDSKVNKADSGDDQEKSDKEVTKDKEDNGDKEGKDNDNAAAKKDKSTDTKSDPAAVEGKADEDSDAGDSFKKHDEEKDVEKEKNVEKDKDNKDAKSITIPLTFDLNGGRLLMQRGNVKVYREQVEPQLEQMSKGGTLDPAQKQHMMLAIALQMIQHMEIGQNAILNTTFFHMHMFKFLSALLSMASQMSLQGKIEARFNAEKGAYYDRYCEAIKKEEEIKLSHIEVDNEKKAEEIIRSLQGGADFGKMATENSIAKSKANGGEEGYTIFSFLPVEFASHLSSLKTGEFSAKPVAIQGKYHVLMIRDRRPLVPESIEKIQDSLSIVAVQDVIEQECAGASKNAIVIYEENGTPANTEAVKKFEKFNAEEKAKSMKSIYAFIHVNNKMVMQAAEARAAKQKKLPVASGEAETPINSTEGIEIPVEQATAAA